MECHAGARCTLTVPKDLSQSGVDGTGQPLDVLIDSARATIIATGVALGVVDGVDMVDRSGMVLLPAPADPHAHLEGADHGSRAQRDG